MRVNIEKDMYRRGINENREMKVGHLGDLEFNDFYLICKFGISEEKL